MPARRSNLWLYFKKQPTGEKAQCLMCGQLMSLEKSTFTNLRRHIHRKHPDLQDQVVAKLIVLGPRIWNHYVKEPGKRARCQHCDTSISYQYTTSSLARHLRAKHSDVFVKEDNANDNDHKEEDYIEKMYNTGGEQHSVKELISSNESDEEYDYKDYKDDDALVELQSVQNAKLTEPIKLELMDTNSQLQEHGSIDDGGNVHQIGKLQIHPRDHRNLVQNEHDQDYDIIEVLEETVIEQVNVPAPASSSDVDETKHSNNVCRDQLTSSFNMANIPTKTAAYATYTALEMETLSQRQRTIAQKLISDILFNAKLDNLAENSMLVVRVGTFEEE
ncbi:uncharacterized protein LOC126560494 [Anopheles maculipalpis]|uniref:uncharacterized protein LOC126560494 n=1 Tax=Anopheles maculipalpis TaxID=1496333 RepID=UPI002159A842|nr:uncharacterized protein LOC126560494 [Anopheles maculipalpis]